MGIFHAVLRHHAHGRKAICPEPAVPEVASAIWTLQDFRESWVAWVESKHFSLMKLRNIDRSTFSNEQV